MSPYPPSPVRERPGAPNGARGAGRPVQRRPVQRRPADDPPRPASGGGRGPGSPGGGGRGRGGGGGPGGSNGRRGYRLRSPGKRLRTATVLIAVLFLLLASRLVQLQGFKSKQYAAAAEKQRMTKVDLPATRGEILDRNGNVLAVSVDSYDVAVRPKLVKDAWAEAQALAPLLKTDVGLLLARMLDNSSFRYLAYEVDAATVDKVRKLKFTNLQFDPAQKRLYPAGATASNVLGFVKRDDSGAAGLEYAYNASLAGQAGLLRYETDPDGRIIPSGVHREKEPVAGKGIKLTLDRDMQFATQAALGDAVTQSGARKGVAIVMNPRTGDIYAMAAAPGYNANDPQSISAATDLSNPDVAWTFEPGSVNKLVTVSAAVEEKVANPLTPIEVPISQSTGYGPKIGINVADRVITDSEDHPAQRMTVAGVLAKSSNQGTLLISRMLNGQDERAKWADLEKWLRAFGLGQKTGVGLPGESPGLLKPSSQWLTTDAATIPFGQSMSVNALQVASAYATIANGGVRVTPRIIAGTIDGKGDVVPAAPGVSRRVVSPQTAKTVTNMLEQVTSTSGTGSEATVPGYRIAGKTGTANRYDDKLKVYSGYVASFVGFAPADNPQLLVLVSIDDPKTSIFGGSVAAPAFSKIMGFALTKMQVPPTGTKAPDYPLCLPANAPCLG